MVEVTRSLYKVHKSNEYVTTEDCFFIKQIVIELPKENYRNNQKDHMSPQELQTNAEEEAENLISNAKAKAEEIILKAKQEAEAVSETIKQSAYDEGYQTGKNEGYNEIGGKIEDAKDILKKMVQEKNELINDLKPDIVKLSIKIAEKIIQEQLDIDDKKYLSFISNAVKKASGSEISIFVNPKQFERIDELKEMLLSQASQIKKIEILKKETIDELDFIIETETGLIDAGVTPQIKKIEQAFELKESCI